MAASTKENSLRFTPYLLTTESQDEFASLYGELEQEIQPNGVIERTYVQDIAYLIWDILRLRRSKTAIINTAFLAALRGILEQLQNRSTLRSVPHRNLSSSRISRAAGLTMRRQKPRSHHCSESLG